MLEQLEAPGGSLGEYGRSAMAERGRHGRLAAGLDVHGAQGQRLALLGERARGGRQPFALVERPLDRDSASLGESSLLAERLRCSSGRRACAGARADPRPPRAASRRARARCVGGRERRPRPRFLLPRQRAPLRPARARRAASPDAHRPRPAPRRAAHGALGPRPCATSAPRDRGRPGRRVSAQAPRRASPHARRRSPGARADAAASAPLARDRARAPPAARRARASARRGGAGA